MNGNPKKKNIYWPGGPVENQLLWPELARPPKKCVRSSGHIANVKPWIQVGSWQCCPTLTGCWWVCWLLYDASKGSFYIAQYPVRWTAQSASHFLPSLTDRFIPTPFSASPGSILARQQLRAKTKSLTFPPLSIARYSFIQLSEQGRQWRERKMPNLRNGSKWGFEPGLSRLRVRHSTTELRRSTSKREVSTQPKLTVLPHAYRMLVCIAVLV